MPQMTERSAKWMESVKANFTKATGKPVEAWVALARSQGHGEDIARARKWLKEKHGLTIVQANTVLTALFPEDEESEDDLLDAQYSGAKAGLRPVYDKLAKAARALGKDVMVAPRKSQVTFARQVSFAVVRAAAKDRVDLLLRLPAQKQTARLVANPKATGSDPTHVVALQKPTDVDREVVQWLTAAYEKAAR
jgi:Domain of unknown function (DUF5655)/Domain of unknown function (DUF4287)